MSYEIVYDRRFIRTPLGITPLILAGSSNCYEPTFRGRRERRERNWSPLFNIAAATEQELMDRVQSCCGGEYQEHFKWHGKFVNDAGFVAFAKNGIKVAMTLEDLQEYGYSGALSCALSIWYRDSSVNRCELETTVSTTDELTRWIETARIRVANRHDREEIYYDMRFFGHEPIQIQRGYAIAGKIVAARGRHYVSGCAPGMLETTMDASKALIFTDLDDAKRRIDACFLRDMRFLKAENVRARQKWRFCIRVQGGYRDGMFMERLTRSRFHMTYNHDTARKFPDKNTAERYIEKRLKGRFLLPGFTVYEIQKDGGEANAQYEGL